MGGKLKILLVLSILISLVSSINYSYALYITGHATKDITGMALKDVTGLATQGNISTGVCINSKPNITSSNCPTSIYTNQSLNCSVNVTDKDINQIMNYSLFFQANKTLFLINSSTGLIYQSMFNTSYVGLHKYNVTIKDNSGCANNFYTKNYSIQLICSNHKPIITSNSCPTKISINDTLNCSVTVNDSDLNQNITYSLKFKNITNTSLYPFTINESSGVIYKYNFTEKEAGIYNYTITINDSYGCNDSNSYNYTLTISKINHPPICSKTISDKDDIPQGMSLLIDMDYFCVDPDLDNLSFVYTSFSPEVGFSFKIEKNKLVFIPQSWFYGEVYVLFSATDTSNVSDNTNSFKIKVKQAETPKPKETSTSGGGGGGGGGSLSDMSGNFSKMLTGAKLLSCIPNWNCSNFSECLPQGFKMRECVDTKFCNISLFRPNLTMQCNYTPTCFDNIQNGDEEGIDCGLNCPNKCEEIVSCFDNIQNGDEEGIDCGGKCDIRCGDETFSCFDGMKNGDENGVDCGGSCQKKCLNIENPLNNKFILNFSQIFIWLVLSLLLYQAIYYSYTSRRSIFRFFKHLKNGFKGGITQNPLFSILEDLDYIEKMLYNSIPEQNIYKLSKIMNTFLLTITGEKQLLTDIELKNSINKLNLKSEVKDLMYNYYKDLQELEFSKKDVNNFLVLTLIYEARSMISFSYNIKGYEFKERIKLSEKDENERIISHFMGINHDFFTGKIRDEVQINKALNMYKLEGIIKNKFILNSFVRFKKLVRVYNAKI